MSKLDDPSLGSDNDFDDDFLSSLDYEDSDLDGLDFSEDDWDSEEDRSPAGQQKSITKQLGDIGAKATKGAAAAIAAGVQKNLPETTRFVDNTLTAISEVDRLRSDVAQQLAPVLNESKKTAGRLLKQVRDVVPEKLYKKLDNFLSARSEDEGYQTPSKDAVREDSVARSLAGIFETQAEERSIERRSNEANRLIDQRLTESRHAESMGGLNSLLNQAMYHTSFLRSTYSAYLKKDLELKYKSIFLQEDLLELTRIQSEMLEHRLDAIRHNTSLPDTQKIHLSEIATRNLKEKGIEWFQSKTSSFLDGVIQKAKTEYIEPFIETMGLLNDVGNSFTEMMSYGEKSTPTKFIASTLGKWGGAALGKTILKKMPKKQKEALERYAQLGPQAIIDKLYRLRDGVDTDINSEVLDSLLDALLPDRDTSAGKFDNKTFVDPNAPGMITRRFTHTVEEIIPGYLSKQTALLQELVTGKPAEELVFDYQSNSFRAKSDYQQAIVERAFGTREDRAARAKGIANEVRSAVSKITRTGDDNYGAKQVKEFDKLSLDMVKFIQNVAKAQYGGFSYKRLAALNGEIKGDKWAEAAFKGIKDPKALLDYLLKILITEDGVVDVAVESSINLAIDRERDTVNRHRRTFFDEANKFGNSLALHGLLDADKDGKLQINNDKWWNINDDITADDISADKVYDGKDEYGFDIKEETAFDRLKKAGSVVKDQIQMGMANASIKLRLGLLSFGEKHGCKPAIENLLQTYDDTKTNISTRLNKMSTKIKSLSDKTKAKVFKATYSQLSRNKELQLIGDLLINKDRTGFNDISPSDTVTYVKAHPKLVNALRSIHEKAQTEDAYALLYGFMPESLQIIAKSNDAADINKQLKKLIEKENTQRSASDNAIVDSILNSTADDTSTSSSTTGSTSSDSAEGMINEAKLNGLRKKYELSDEEVAALRDKVTNSTLQQFKTDKDIKKKFGLNRKGMSDLYRELRKKPKAYASGGTVDLATGEPIGLVDKPTPLANGKAVAGEHGAEVVVPLNRTKAAWRAFMQAFGFHAEHKSASEAAREGFKESTDKNVEEAIKESAKHKTAAQTSKRKQSFKFDGDVSKLMAHSVNLAEESIDIMTKQLSMQESILHLLSGGEVSGLIKKPHVKGVVSKALGAAKSVASKGYNAARTLVGLQYAAAKHTVGAAYSVAKAGVSTTASAIKAGASALFKKGDNLATLYVDVYRADNLSKPIVFAKDLEEGQVVDAETGKQVRSSYTITRPMVYAPTVFNSSAGRSGKFAITEDDIKAGLVDREGRSLKVIAKKVGNLLSRSVSSAAGYVTSAVGKVYGITGRALGLAKDSVAWTARHLKMAVKKAFTLKDPCVDVYTLNPERANSAGSEFGKPLITGEGIRNGRYTFVNNGLPVRSAYNIDSPVCALGQPEKILITYEDIKAGLVDASGKSLTKFSGRSIIGKLTSLAAGGVGYGARTIAKVARAGGRLVKKIAQGGIDFVKGGMSALTGVGGNIKNVFADLTPIARKDLEEIVGLRLDKIYDLLSGQEVRLAKKEAEEAKEKQEHKKQESMALSRQKKKDQEDAHESSAADRNANRRGSYEDQKKNKEEAKKSKADQFKDAIKNSKDKSMSAILAKLGELNGGGSGFTDYLMQSALGKGLGKGLGAIKGGLGALVSGAGGLLARGGGLLAGALGSIGTAAAGTLGSLGAGATGLLGSAGGAIAGLVGSGASALGGLAAGATSALGGLAAGAAPLIAALGPVGLAAAGVAAVGLAGYTAYKIFSDSAETKEWRKKFNSYAGTIDLDSNMLEDFQDEVLDIFDGKRPEFKLEELERWAVKLGFLSENSIGGFFKTIGSGIWDVFTGDGVTALKNTTRGFTELVGNSIAEGNSTKEGSKNREIDREIKLRYFSNWYGARFRPVFNAYAMVIRKYSGAGIGDTPDPDDIPENMQGHAYNEFDKLVKPIIQGEVAEYFPTEKGWKKYKDKHEGKLAKQRADAKHRQISQSHADDRKAVADASDHVDKTIGERIEDSFILRNIKKLGPAGAAIAGTFATIGRMWDDKDKLSHITSKFSLKDAILNPLGTVWGMFKGAKDASYMADNFNEVRITGYVGKEAAHQGDMISNLRELEEVKDAILRGQRKELDRNEVIQWANKFGFDIYDGSVKDKIGEVLLGIRKDIELSELDKKKLAFFNTWYSNRFHPIYNAYFTLVRTYARQDDITIPTDHEKLSEEVREGVLKELNKAIQKVLAKRAMAYFIPTPAAFAKAEAANEASRKNKEETAKRIAAAKKAQTEKEEKRFSKTGKHLDKNGKVVEGNEDAIRDIAKVAKETKVVLKEVIAPDSELTNYELVQLSKKVPELIAAKTNNYNSNRLQAIAQLEKFTKEILDEERDEFSQEELAVIAASFGFSDKNPERNDYLVKYFTTWYVKRFRPMYEILRKVFKKELGYTDTFNISSLNADQIKAIADSWVNSCNAYIRSHNEILHLGTDPSKVSREQVEAKDVKLEDLVKKHAEIVAQRVAKQEAMTPRMVKTASNVETLSDERAKPTQNFASMEQQANRDFIRRAKDDQDNIAKQYEDKYSTSAIPRTTPSKLTRSSSMQSAANDALFGSTISGGAQGNPVNVSLNGLSAADIPDGGSGDLGSYVKRFESGSRGASAIGYDSTGGTSYGTYQFASKNGSLQAFLKWAKTKGKFGLGLYNDMMKAGKLNTGSKSGAAPDVWAKYASVDGGEALNKLEHGHIHEKFYLNALSGIKNSTAKSLINSDRGLQEALWSTSIQHGPGGAKKIFNQTYTEGMTAADWLKAIYDKRGTQFGKSTGAVRNSVLNRFKQELPIVLGLSKSVPNNSVEANTKDVQESNTTDGSAKSETAYSPSTGDTSSDSTNNAEVASGATGTDGVVRPTASDVVTSPFGPRNVKGGSKNHKGIDLRAKMGDPIFAMKAGTVTQAGGQYGTVAIDHGGNLVTRYLHLKNFAVQPGQTVQAGDTIGAAGGRGPSGVNQYAPHLHFDVLQNGNRIDPEKFLKGSGVQLHRKGEPGNPDMAPASDAGAPTIDSNSASKETKANATTTAGSSSLSTSLGANSSVEKGKLEGISQDNARDMAERVVPSNNPAISSSPGSTSVPSNSSGVVKTGRSSIDANASESISNTSGPATGKSSIVPAMSTGVETKQAISESATGNGEQIAILKSMVSVLESIRDNLVNTQKTSTDNTALIEAMQGLTQALQTSGLGSNSAGQRSTMNKQSGKSILDTKKKVA